MSVHAGDYGGAPLQLLQQGALKWDPKNLEIRTMSVEKTLEPLVLQVTTLVNTGNNGTTAKKKGKSKRASVLVLAVTKATENFIERGEQIANENPDIKLEMLEAVDEVRKHGGAMSAAAGEFSEDPCSSAKRAGMVRASRSLLSAVTRLLVLADMVDVHLLLKSLYVVEADLDKLRTVSSQDELVANMRQFGRNAAELINQAAKRQQELKDPQLRDDLAAARAVLRKSTAMLLTASKVYVRHPELDVAKQNRDQVFMEVCKAVHTISDVAQGKQYAPPVDVFGGAGELAAALDDFDEGVIMDPMSYNEMRTRPALEARLESIISASALMADADCTRDERRERIVAECNAVRQALQELLSEYMANNGRQDQSAPLNRAINQMCRKTRDLRRQLRKAVVDHVSDSFLETTTPLIDLIQAAQSGHEKRLADCADIFTKHAEKLVEVANLVCSMSGNEDGVKMVRYAAVQIERLCPQVINAARILAARPNSKVTQENMDAYRGSWEMQVRVLTEAVDDITTIDDFLAVSENHILEDVNKCVMALQERDAHELRYTAGAIHGRSQRVCAVVEAEMDNYEPCVYTRRVLEAVKVLRDKVMAEFVQRVDVAVGTLAAAGGGGARAAGGGDVDENDFIDASRLVYDAVREIRRAVLMNRNEEELDPDDIEFDEHYATETRSKSSAQTGEGTACINVDEYPDISGITNAREAMRKMTEEDKMKIAQQVELFRKEKMTFDSEVAKWDDTGNDIIFLAKHMCMIMMEMTDFTRGRGPLKTTMDVINAAKKISEAGTKLDKLTREIAELCPESSTKKDLLAFLQRIALYCHQIQITSKVKADVQNISGELIVSGLDSATSLIQAAKNLMNAVVLTVKYSYVASTKYTRQGVVSSPIVVWKMKAPEKKPLVRPEKPEEVRAKVRKGSQKKVQNPVHALSEFQSPTDGM